MIALFSALLGFLGAALPEGVALFREGKDRAHELALLKLQMAHQEQQAAAQKETARIQAESQLEALSLASLAKESLALNARVKDSLVGIAWVDALSGSVRPILTYLFCLLYISIKWAQFYALLYPMLPWQQGLRAQEAMMMVWTQDDMALFTAIIAFWFGQRTFHKAKK